MIKAKGLERHKKTAKIYAIKMSQVDDLLQEIDDITGPPSTPLAVPPPKLPPEATAKTVDLARHFPPHMVPVIKSFADVFDQPTELTPSRPEDLKIDLIPGSSPPANTSPRSY